MMCGYGGCARFMMAIMSFMMWAEGGAVRANDSGIQGVAPPAVYPQNTWKGRSEAVVRVLNRLDSHVEYLTIPIGEEKSYRSVTIRAQACLERPTTLPEDTAGWLHIEETKAADVPIFDGWMLASAPALGVYSNPLYNVQIVSCRGKDVEPQPGPLPKPQIPSLSIIAPQRVDADNIHPPTPPGVQNGGGPMSLLPPSSPSPSASSSEVAPGKGMLP